MRSKGKRTESKPPLAMNLNPLPFSHRACVRSNENDLYERGITPEKLSAQWAIFGEDPFIFGGSGSVPFSARKFVTTELCEAVIDSFDVVSQDQ